MNGNLEMTVRTGEYRPCIVDGKKALFHRWTDFANVVGESPLRGGHSAGQIHRVYGIVEFEDGTVKEVEPYTIKFTDSLFFEYAIPEERIKPNRE